MQGERVRLVRKGGWMHRGGRPASTRRRPGAADATGAAGPRTDTCGEGQAAVFPTCYGIPVGLAYAVTDYCREGASLWSKWWAGWTPHAHRRGDTPAVRMCLHPHWTQRLAPSSQLSVTTYAEPARMP